MNPDRVGVDASTLPIDATTPRTRFLQGAAGAVTLAEATGKAEAQTRAETLRYVTGATINTLDTTMPGAMRESFGLSMNVYDRLFSFGSPAL